MNSFWKGDYDINEHTNCSKPDCSFCEKVKNNDGRATEKNLLKLGLVQKEKINGVADLLEHRFQV
jgi:hypothetical protein